ncbi:MAG: hypothetical protein Q7Q71_04230 [Verrucomicrobiota bacterium JB023]|nr:hypothetical protein [Verrucomicrobiota bacterium JB023]
MASDPMHLYYAKWLPRARRLLSPSGRLSELAHTLAAKDEVPAEDWRSRLRRVLDGHEQPDADLVFEVERFVARPLPEPAPDMTRELKLPS